jgi:hypothetical protein
VAAAYQASSSRRWLYSRLLLLLLCHHRSLVHVHGQLLYAGEQRVMTALQRVHALRQAADQTILQGSSTQGAIMHQSTRNAANINVQ